MEVHVGSRVRIRVSGRRLKGFVTALFEPEAARKLLPIEGLSGNVPSFDESTLATLRWAATHYVSPLSVVLRRTTPPNVPSAPAGVNVQSRRTVRSHDMAKPLYRIGSSPYGSQLASTIESDVEAGRNVVIIAPTVHEIEEIATHLRSLHGEKVVLATSSMPGAEVTGSWLRTATGSQVILIGTREIMLWPYGDVGVVAVVEDGRRVMRSPATPTLSVREVMAERSRREEFSLVFHGPVPTLETIALGTAIDSPSHRQWPMVEIVDRAEEPPSGAALTERVKAAIAGTVRAGNSVFVLVGSRGYAPAFRCVKCGEVRRCPICSSAGSRDDSCRRCGASLGACSKCGASQFQALGAGVGRIVDNVAAFVGADHVGRAGEGMGVTIGTERDLIGVRDVGLAVAVDSDGLTMAPHYRAQEDGLRLLVRLAQTVRRGAGNRCVIQTAQPAQPVLDTLVRGRSEEFLAVELESRRRFGFPPVGALIAIETEGEHGAGDLLMQNVAEHATILGPAPVGSRMRWLIQGRDLDAARVALRPVLNTLRSKGAKVRVDVDPIDL